MAPESALSKPTISLIKTDFPVPDFPKTTRFSCSVSFNARPFKTISFPKDYAKSLISIIGLFILFDGLFMMLSYLLFEPQSH